MAAASVAIVARVASVAESAWTAAPNPAVGPLRRRQRPHPRRRAGQGGNLPPSNPRHHDLRRVHQRREAKRGIRASSLLMLWYGSPRPTPDGPLPRVQCGSRLVRSGRLTPERGSLRATPDEGNQAGRAYSSTIRHQRRPRLHRRPPTLCPRPLVGHSSRCQRANGRPQRQRAEARSRSSRRMPWLGSPPTVLADGPVVGKRSGGGRQGRRPGRSPRARLPPCRSRRSRLVPARLHPPRHRRRRHRRRQHLQPVARATERTDLPKREATGFPSGACSSAGSARQKSRRANPGTWTPTSTDTFATIASRSAAVAASRLPARL
mmetsp:Transcript_40252/g.106271  ORF Transcript_40252/g.106271 Transcript_40252/m.106271 type:complete len:321 (-) Transcript_40252:1370-2332(-)